MLQAVLFDLDGTLADTALDLGEALNQLLISKGLEPIPMSLIRPVASHGTRGLLKLGMNIDESNELFDELKQVFLQNYEQSLTNKTRLFPNVDLLIQQIVNYNLKWGIITNKPKAFTNRLVDYLQFSYLPDVIVSGDTTSEAKPSVKPMFFACNQINVEPQNCLYVGDAQRDIVAGRNASMRTVLAAWGYLTETEKAEDWGANYTIKTPLELIYIIHSLLS